MAVALEVVTVDRLVVATEDAPVADLGVSWEAKMVDTRVEVTAMGGWVVATEMASMVAWVAVVMEEAILEDVQAMMTEARAAVMMVAVVKVGGKQATHRCMRLGTNVRAV